MSWTVSGGSVTTFHSGDTETVTIDKVQGVLRDDGTQLDVIEIRGADGAKEKVRVCEVSSMNQPN